VFLAKKILGPLLAPLPFCLLVLLSGIFLLWATRRQKAGKTLVTLGTVLLCLFSYSMVSDKLLKPLEQQYPPVLTFEQLQNIKWIVVLGGGSSVDPGLPHSSFLSKASFARMAEGIRIHNQIPNSKLIFTGGSGFSGFTPVAEIMAKVAIEFGVKPAKIIIESKSTDTKDHPLYMKALIGSDKFILVTSASHLPRAMALFTKAGMHPVAAPTDFMASSREALSPRVFFPCTESLQKAERAIHEYLGLAWAKLRSQI
jgi:uncharacterized SAM-binding protein YcdF (DUF218 family)